VISEHNVYKSTYYTGPHETNSISAIFQKCVQNIRRPHHVLKEKVGKDGEKNNFEENVTLPRYSTSSRFIAFMVVGSLKFYEQC
jgi:hypothetical protein